MSRLFSAIRWDVILQIRNGFYAATAFVAGFWTLVLLQAPALNWTMLLPPMLVGNLLLGTFYFIGGLVLLERDEGTLQAQVVTPLRVDEYLASKTITLTALATIETLFLAILIRGWQFQPLALLAGTALASAIYCLAGFVAVVRYASINAYVLPSGLYAGLLWVPLLASLAEWRPWPLYLHPLMAPLVLVEAASGDAPWWHPFYGLLYGSLWVALLLAWSRRAFRRWLIEREGEA